MRLIIALAALALAGLPAAAQTASTTSAARTHDFRVGALRLTALEDSVVKPFPIAAIYRGAEGARAGAALRAAGLPADTVSLGVTVLLVRSGDRLVLIDSGNGVKAEGRLVDALARAGVRPGRITDLLISHPHPDHVGGLVGADGRPAFPRARVHLHPDAWAAMQADPQQAALAAAIRAQVTPLGGAMTVAPGVTAVPIAGHTPGHVGVAIASRGERLLAIGDAMHHYVVSVAQPRTTIAFDGDEAVAEASRAALLARAARDKSRLFAPHFPFPGLGRIAGTPSAGFRWRPEPR